MNRPNSNSRSCVEVIAHRGASTLAPENTLGAVRLAWELGADAVEIDVHLSANRQLVVIHDETLDRTAGRGGRVGDLTAEELSRIDVGSWFGTEWEAERVATLREIIATVPDGKRLFVELKCESAAVDALAGPLADVAEAPQKVALIGFDRDLMRAVKQRYSKHKAFLVAEQKLDGQVWRPTVDELIVAAMDAGLDGLDLSNTLAVDREAVNQIHEAGLSCCVWTVNSLDDVRRLIEAGVESLTMDDPRLLDSDPATERRM
ncbi:MAG: glycerophosphodiester phosphodiesterase family protein [Planctomycetota bacterium]|nr:glycerophosphodiester phosphodiesterase family protein [Planctomycetota bacterium]MDA1251924.1 glycerophosphodiester phosphodiesterase family protein [Planctomycetota bacterium]